MLLFEKPSGFVSVKCLSLSPLKMIDRAKKIFRPAVVVDSSLRNWKDLSRGPSLIKIPFVCVEAKYISEDRVQIMFFFRSFFLPPYVNNYCIRDENCDKCHVVPFIRNVDSDFFFFYLFDSSFPLHQNRICKQWLSCRQSSLYTMLSFDG